MRNLTKLITALLLLLLVSCGKHNHTDVFTVNQVCHGESIEGGVKMVCGEEEHIILDGTDGKDGEFLGYTELVEVCPEIQGDYKETLLMLDGEFMAFLTDRDSNKQRLVKLVEDTIYTTTDKRKAKFSIERGTLVCLTLTQG